MRGYRAVVVGGIVVLGSAMFVSRVSREMPDFEVYWQGAARAAAGEPLYRADDEHYQFKYLPAFAILTIPVSFVPLPHAKAAWFIGSVGLVIVFVASALRLLPDQRKPAVYLCTATVVVLGKFFAHELILGQANVLFGVVALSALLAMKRGREALAGTLVGLTVAIKPYGILLLPWLIVRRKLTSVLAACLTLTAIGLLPVAWYGTETAALYQRWWQTVSESTPSNLLNPDNVSLAAMYAKWLGPGLSSACLAVLTGLALLACAAVAFVKRRGLLFPEGLEGSMLLMVIPLLSPQGWDYVLLLSAPAVMFLANYVDRLPTVPRAVASAAGLIMGLSLFDLMGRTAYQAFMAGAVISVCALVLVGVLVALRLKRIA